MSEVKRIAPREAEGLVRKKWNDHHASWLVGGGAEGVFPLFFILNRLTEKDVVSSLAATRDWVQSWRQWDPKGCDVEWANRRWSSGNQELPLRLTVPGAEVAADLLGYRSDWERAKRRYMQWCGLFPKLVGSRAVARCCDDVLAGYSDADFERLTRLLHWFEANPRSALYLRQLPVPDVDTKWVERRKGPVGDLVRHLLAAPEAAGFHEVCGLRLEPARLRLRVLCPDLRVQVGGLCDIEAPIAEVAALPLQPTCCLVVENLNTGIALPDMRGTVAFMRLGLAVDQLEPIEWARRAGRQLYWGDADTHGFAALARARRRFPGMQSLLMDEATLLSHQALWVREEKPSKVEAPEGLTPSEQAVYEGLRTNRWGEQVRLEQERISWAEALAALDRTVFGT
jgi:hypothetical protein